MSASNLPPYEEIEHTADLALRVRGATLGQLFVHAAQGVFALTHTSYPANKGQPVTPHIALEAPDLETLLVDWLNELLYLSDREHCSFVDYEIVSVSPTQIEAIVRGVSPHPPTRGIKAVTFYDLQIIQQSGYYEATITCDV